MEFTKLKKIHNREISEFAANHLLFEFSKNSLDPERKDAVEKALERSPDLQNEFIRLINGIQYCEKLSETLVTDAAIKQIEQQSSQVNFIVNRLRWHHWPLGFRWLLEASVVGMLLVIVLNVLPLNRLIHINEVSDSQNIIAEMDRKKKTDFADPIVASKQDPAFVDEEIKQPVQTVVAAKDPAPADLKPSVDSLKATKVAPIQPAMVSTPTMEKATQSKSIGWIYRGQFLVTNAEAISPKIKDRIVELGGQKAGEVEIGWQKTPNIFYFHFTVPEAKLPELEAVLKNYSTGKMVKEAHPRVMPDGIVRLLFTVEEKSPTNK